MSWAFFAAGPWICSVLATKEEIPMKSIDRKLDRLAKQIASEKAPIRGRIAHGLTEMVPSDNLPIAPAICAEKMATTQLDNHVRIVNEALHFLEGVYTSDEDSKPIPNPVVLDQAVNAFERANQSPSRNKFQTPGAFYQDLIDMLECQVNTIKPSTGAADWQDRQNTAFERLWRAVDAAR